ncbi:MAG: hypothetical protein KF775_11490 [Cyclobacteriaceae bacterium]|nr:hypothetical protein [Cyclobacteriaceae bacterium]
MPPLKPFIPFLLAFLPKPAWCMGFSFIFFGFSFLLKMFVGVAQNCKARIMNTPKIKTHRITDEFTNQNHFFILSKGNNAGKPLLNPCPNCFVVIACNLEEKEYFYWLCYGLWVGGFFRQVLVGSVIPFLRIGELHRVINATKSKVAVRKEALLNSLEILNKLSTHQENLVKQIQLIKQAKKAIMYKVLS